MGVMNIYLSSMREQVFHSEGHICTSAEMDVDNGGKGLREIGGDLYV